MTASGRAGIILLWMAMLCVHGKARAGDAIALISVGESWAWLESTNNAFPARGEWESIEFEDSGWSRGPSGFSSQRDEATVLSPLTSQPTVLFRKIFHVDDPSAVQSLVLRANYDAGYVALLNGEEVARRGLPEGEPGYEQYAPAPRIHEEAEEIDLTFQRHLLLPGENILSVELHSASNSPFNKTFVGELLANFTRGPLVQSVSATSAIIVWKTAAPSSGAVSLGATSNALDREFTFDAPSLTHAVTVSGLLPGTPYAYRVRSEQSEGTAVSPVFTFTTLRDSGPIRFVVVGDTGGGGVPQYNVARQVELARPDFVLHLGDIVYEDFTAGAADLRFFSVYRKQMREVSWFTTVGNHEMDTITGDSVYLESMYLPTNSASGTEDYYSFDHGEGHFVCLFLPDLRIRPGFGHLALTNGSAQYTWLTNDLARTTKPWKILFFHLPVSTSSFHAAEDLNANNRSDQVDIQEVLLPIARQYGIQLIFNGHDHNYERFAPIDGVHRIVSGGGGRSVYSLFLRDPTSAQFYSRYQFVRVLLDGKHLELEAIDQQGESFDRMVIHRVQPETNYASWNSPVVEPAPANDGDDNINGQSFDFVGDGIPTGPGAWANLGTLYVNNDQTNLYLGLRDVMIQNDSDIYLFIEVPSLPGVSNLVGMGDGSTGTEEGVDALDFAENLAFTNFAPSVVALLGDEAADGTFPQFSRSGTDVAGGQGVFSLAPGFPAISGARVQQYNRSPQTTNGLGHEGFRAERNADFIEVAIPFSSLGDLRPDQTIKVAVVAGGAIDTNRQVRAFDTAVAGGISASGTNPITVTPISVRLSEGIDTDGDGLRDEWELAHGLDPHSAFGESGANGDPDGDGFTNLSEQLAGTDPRDGASAVRVHGSLLSQNVLRLSWDAVVGKKYQLESSSDLQAAFVPEPGDWPRVAGPSPMVFDVFLDSDGSHEMHFYRVRVVP